MDVSEMEIYRDKFIVMECLSSSIEMYQVKTFYYQSIVGHRKFRFSMSQNKSYLYYDNKGIVSLNDFLQQKYTSNDLYRVLNQIHLILLESSNYLLYLTNYCLQPNWISIVQLENDLKVELLYLPFKENVNMKYMEHCECFVRTMSKAFNEVNDMEGFYYFIRLLDEFKDKDYTFELLQHLDYFLKRMESSLKKKHVNENALF